MKNNVLIAVVTMAIFAAGGLVAQAQTNLQVETRQQSEVQSDADGDGYGEAEARSDSTTSASSEMQAQDADSDGDGISDADDAEGDDPAGASYNNSRSNRSTVRSDSDADGDGYGDADAETRDADSDADGLSDGAENANQRATKEVDQASPKIYEALSIDADSPLRNPGVKLGVRGDVCVSDEDCDDNESDVRPGRAAVISVSGDQVRGWSEEAKAAARQRLEAASEVNTANDFGLRVASAALNDEAVVDITSDKDTTEVRYKTRLHILGFIPATTTATVRATAEGETSVEYPWYSFLARKADASSYSQLAAELRSDHDLFIAVEEEGVKQRVREDNDAEE